MGKRILFIVLFVFVVMKAACLDAQEFLATKNGKKYHQADCMLAKDKGLKGVSAAQIEERKLSPCGHCLRGLKDKVLVKGSNVQVF